MKNTDPVLIIGNDDLTASVAVCLLNAKHQVCLSTQNPGRLMSRIIHHFHDQKKYNKINHPEDITLLSDLNNCKEVKLAVIISPENIELKEALLEQVTKLVSPDTIIAINTESIELNILKNRVKNSSNLIGLNWAEPAHTTFFLEVIKTENNTKSVNEVYELAKHHWKKDPYIVVNEGVRNRLLSALIREAAYLVENEYASIEDIDRACRNDAGYYLPFCGNCRYMDMMGTYAYGVVMKDLNPDLSKENIMPDFMTEKLKSGDTFYDYGEEGVEGWKERTGQFSYQIQSIIEKYPFNYLHIDFQD